MTDPLSPSSAAVGSDPDPTASTNPARFEWAVRSSLERAQQIVRMYAEPVLLRRTVTVGAWEVQS